MLARKDMVKQLEQRRSMCITHLELELALQRQAEEALAGLELLIYELLRHAMICHCKAKRHTAHQPHNFLGQYIQP